MTFVPQITRGLTWASFVKSGSTSLTGSAVGCAEHLGVPLSSNTSGTPGIARDSGAESRLFGYRGIGVWLIALFLIHATLLGHEFWSVPAYASIAVPTDNLQRPENDSQYKVVDLVPAYLDIEKSRGDVTGFERIVIDPNREVWESVAQRWVTNGHTADLFKALQGTADDLRLVEAKFRTRFATAWKRLKKEIPMYRQGFTVYVLPAPRNAVGGSVRPLSNGIALILGSAELRSVIDSQEAFDVLVQHELTHAVHVAENPEMRRMVQTVYLPPFEDGKAKLYQVLWLEGLGVWHSKELNPRATDKETLLSDHVANEVAGRWRYIAAYVLAHLDSTKLADIYPLMFDSPSPQNLPKRTGYYIGMLIARQLARKHTFEDLCRMSGDQLRLEIGIALKVLARTTKVGVARSK